MWASRLILTERKVAGGRWLCRLTFFVGRFRKLRHVLNAYVASPRRKHDRELSAEDLNGVSLDHFR
jgi:hypothetical protein